MKMLNCPECGLTITDTQKECPKCRTKIEVIKVELEKESETAEEKKGAKKIPAKKVSKKIKDEADEDKKPKSIKDEMIAAVVEAEALAAIETIENDSAKVKEEIIAAAVEAEALAAIEEEEAATDENLCETCLAPVDDGQNFCQLCGSSVEAIEETVNPIIPKTDEESNKFIAAIGYVVFFFPILCGYYRKSAFAKFHAKQATLLFISSTVLFLGLIIFRDILNSLFTTYLLDLDFTISTAWQHGFGVFFHFYLIGMINILHLMPFALMLIGIVNAFQGKKKYLPIIGRFIKKEEEVTTEAITQTIG